MLTVMWENSRGRKCGIQVPSLALADRYAKMYALLAGTPWVKVVDHETHKVTIYKKREVK